MKGNEQSGNGTRVRISFCVSEPCLATTSSCVLGRSVPRVEMWHQPQYSTGNSPHSYSMTTSLLIVWLIIELTFKGWIYGIKKLRTRLGLCWLHLGEAASWGTSSTKRSVFGPLRSVSWSHPNHMGVRLLSTAWRASELSHDREICLCVLAISPQKTQGVAQGWCQSISSWLIAHDLEMGKTSRLRSIYFMWPLSHC